VSKFHNYNLYTPVQYIQYLYRPSFDFIILRLKCVKRTLYIQLTSNYICTDKAYKHSATKVGEQAHAGNHLCLQNIQCT
jgi:hypothetical protein